MDGEPERVSIGSTRIKASFPLTSPFIIETPSPPGSVALFPQGFAFYVSHHHSLHSSFNLFIRRLGVGSIWLGVSGRVIWRRTERCEWSEYDPGAPIGKADTEALPCCARV